MKLAAVKAIAELATKPVPDIVNVAYNQKNLSFGREYIIPKPVDPRLLTTVAPAVAKAAMESGVARKQITDWEAYERELRLRMGSNENIIWALISKAKQDPQKVVFAEGESYKVLKAAQIVQEEGIAKPILLGNEVRIRQLMKEYSIEIDATIIDPKSEDSKPMVEKYAKILFEKRKRRGFNLYEAQRAVKDRSYYGLMMLETGEADAFVSGMERKYEATVRPALNIIEAEPNTKISGMYMMLTKGEPIFLADTTVIQNPTADDLVGIAYLAAQEVKQFNIQPRIAFLSYSNFGSSDDLEPRTVREAVRKFKEKYPHIIADGEIQANVALNPQILSENYPFSDLMQGSPNILIFPNLASGNIAYKLLQELGTAEAVGPILLGMKKSVHILQLGSSVREIVNMVTIAVVDAQEKKKAVK